MSTEALHMNDIAVEIASQNAMARGARFLPNGHRLFGVTAGWESASICASGDVDVVDSALALAGALAGPGGRAIFIPADALLSDEAIESVCRRCGTPRTFFREMEE